MVGTQPEILAVDPRTRGVVWHCPGPDARGACGRVAVGAEVPCIGLALTDADASGEAYVVPPHMTLCPVTLALSLDVSMQAGIAPHSACHI
jgi:hypothetical protein